MKNQHPANEPLANRSLDDIEDEIATLSATIAAATCRLLFLIGELDRRDGWGTPLDSRGFRSCAHWLCRRVGHSLGVARQYVRVARALPDLPHITEAFSRGEVSWSKVRAITRTAIPDNEEDWLHVARGCTASHVEKLVSKYRRANRVEENDRALEQQRFRRVTAFFDGDGTFRFLSPDGRELEAAPALPEVSDGVTGGAGAVLRAHWVDPEVRITRDTGHPEWDGEPVDYDWVLGCLLPPRRPQLPTPPCARDGIS